MRPFVWPRLFKGWARLTRPIQELGLRRFDQVIFGGGTCFQTYQNFESFGRILDRVKGGRYFAVGVSVGPFFDARAQDECKTFLDKLEFIGVRDEVSYDRAIKLTNPDKVKYTFDLAVLLPLALDQRSAQPSVRKGLGVALSNYDSFFGLDMDTQRREPYVVADALLEVVKDSNVEELVVIDFNSSSNFRRYQCKLNPSQTDRTAL